MAFNRTAYGIEIIKPPAVFIIQLLLLIAPLMELKYYRGPYQDDFKVAFNRTAYGIEMS